MNKQTIVDATAVKPPFELEPELFELRQTDAPIDDHEASQQEFYFQEGNPEQPDPTPQIDFDGMAKPIYSVAIGNIDNNTSTQTVVLFQHANTLLESLEAQEVYVPYQCRDGYCGSCRTTKISGDVVYLQEPMACINDDEILPCCCVPKSDLKLKLL